MARFYGAIGYGISVEKPPNSGIWVEEITERMYRGSIIRNTTQQNVVQDLNDNVVFSNTSISIVTDGFAIDNLLNIKYVMLAGLPWTVNSVEVQRPRLTLIIGKDYNGPTA